MKKLIIGAGLLLVAFAAQAQADTTKVEQYCILVAQQKLMSSKVNITLELGEKTSIWKDRRLKDEKGNVIDFNSVVDALNYMGKTGWSLMAAYPISTSNGNQYQYVFKRMFPLQETQ